MNSNTRWQFNPFDQTQPLKKHESQVQPGLPRVQSLTELQGPQPNPVLRPTRPPVDRICKDVPFPLVQKLRIDELFDFRHGEKINIDLLVHHLKNEGRLADSTWRHLLYQAKALLVQEPNIVPVSYGCTIVGDIHGQYYDLLTIFELGGPIGQQTYVFLGDYVDRALKINHPRSIILLRGNHESRQMTQVFTYKKECQVKYSLDLWYESMLLFDCLPICALIDERFLCMHAGLSPHLQSLNDIVKLNRFQEIPSEGPFCDLMWSDPHPQFANRQTLPWVFNKQRNCSFCFNYSVCERFLIENRILAVIRAHEVVPTGLKFFEKGSLSQFPVLISLFSAPNYCDVYNNTAAIIVYDHRRNFRPVHYRHRPHPFVLPNHENGFEFGHRLMKTYVQEIILALIQGYTKSLSRTDRDDVTTEKLKTKEQMLNEHTHKCRRMNKMNIQLGNLAPSEHLQAKALHNENVFDQATTSLNKSLVENDPVLAFDSASKIDALYEERVY
ncbi:unnamed protein product [Adineta ricciae]|uniref:Serine/threonine-protein phosphatase n=1 Tax=Adineta ricciae TaxID=249248 RepID=A0A813PGF2_ADIRI|nr:unnamed protein product [Adineta ricciae]